MMYYRPYFQREILSNHPCNQFTQLKKRIFKSERKKSRAMLLSSNFNSLCLGKKINNCHVSIRVVSRKKLNE